MLKYLCMKWSWSMGIIVLLVALGTVFLMFNRLPEERVIISDDGLFTIEAWVGESISIVVSENEATASNIISQIYDVQPSEAQLTTFATITIRYSEESLGDTQAEELIIGYFDEVAEVWRTVPSTIDLEAQTVSAEVDHLSSWGLVVNRQVELGGALNEAIQSIAQDIPVGATGLLIETAYGLVGEAPVLVPGVLLSGGCGGVYERGQETYQNIESLEATAQINGVSQTVQFRVVGTWAIGKGCTTTSPFTNQSF